MTTDAANHTDSFFWKSRCSDAESRLGSVTTERNESKEREAKLRKEVTDAREFARELLDMLEKATVDNEWTGVVATLARNGRRLPK